MKNADLSQPGVNFPQFAAEREEPPIGNLQSSIILRPLFFTLDALARSLRAILLAGPTMSSGLCGFQLSGGVVWCFD